MSLGLNPAGCGELDGLGVNLKCSVRTILLFLAGGGLVPAGIGIKVGGLFANTFDLNKL